MSRAKQAVSINWQEATFLVFGITGIAYCSAFTFEAGYIEAFNISRSSAQVVNSSFFLALGLLAGWGMYYFLLGKLLGVLLSHVFKELLLLLPHKRRFTSMHSELLLNSLLIGTLLALPLSLLMDLKGLNAVLCLLVSVLVSWFTYRMIMNQSYVGRIVFIVFLLIVYISLTSYSIGRHLAQNRGFGVVTTIDGQKYGLVRDYGNKFLFVEISDGRYPHIGNKIRFIVDESVQFEINNEYKDILKPTPLGILKNSYEKWLPL